MLGGAKCFNHQPSIIPPAVAPSIYLQLQAPAGHLEVVSTAKHQPSRCENGSTYPQLEPQLQLHGPGARISRCFAGMDSLGDDVPMLRCMCVCGGL